MTQWDKYRQSIQTHLDTDSIDKCLEWSTIQATMYVGNAPYIPKVLGIIPVGDYEIVSNPKVGTQNTDHLCTNLIHQYHHLRQWLNRTRQKLSEMSAIVELGAGYGAMALLCHRLGFEGRYYIIDFPELVRLQRYYLWGTLGSLDNFYWSLPGESCDLFIASHSLGEMPIPERERLLSQVAAKEYLFASSYEYEEVDNAGWFQQFAGGTVGLNWTFYPHPYQENAFYQVGVEL